MTYRDEVWPAAKLKGYEKNAKKHPPEQIAALRASLREFGFTIPIFAREDGTIMAGHGRLQAAIEEGFTDVPVRIPVGWSEAKCRAYTIADNRLAEMASWDASVLQEELAALSLEGFDLEALGFSQADIDAMAEELAAPAETPAAYEPNVSQAGALAERFGLPPFSVLNAREGWWQRRKAAWVALGIRSEIGRGENLAFTGQESLDLIRGRAPGGSPLPAADYGKSKARGDGRGRAMK